MELIFQQLNKSKIPDLLLESNISNEIDCKQYRDHRHLNRPMTGE